MSGTIRFWFKPEDIEMDPNEAALVRGKGTDGSRAKHELIKRFQPHRTGKINGTPVPFVYVSVSISDNPTMAEFDSDKRLRGYEDKIHSVSANFHFTLPPWVQRRIGIYPLTTYGDERCGVDKMYAQVEYETNHQRYSVHVEAESIDMIRDFYENLRAGTCWPYGDYDWSATQEEPRKDLIVQAPSSEEASPTAEERLRDAVELMLFDGKEFFSESFIGQTAEELIAFTRKMTGFDGHLGVYRDGKKLESGDRLRPKDKVTVKKLRPLPKPPVMLYDD